MKKIIKGVIPGSPASRTVISPGDELAKINGSVVTDVLDYKYLSYDARLILELKGMGGRLKIIRMHKPEGSDLGLEFESFLMDEPRSCANKCIFCFIDQLPGGMRETLYYKDDDVRLSFLQGNYVTLTNLSGRDIERIVRLRISPINVSIHTLDPGLRAYMLGTKRGADGIGALEALAEAGIALNCQIVCCPGINDGVELDRTMKGLYALGRGINSVSVVPVGLTKHRRGLTLLQPFDRISALKAVRQVEAFAGKCLKESGLRRFFCADELYITAGLDLPESGFYEDYPQLENGVGMMRLFITEFEEGLKKRRSLDSAAQTPFSIATGAAAGGYIEKLLMTAHEKYDTINGVVYTIQNFYFGESVSVSGLVTGRDIIEQLKGRELGARLLIPQNMLRRGEDVFLDDVTVAGLSEALGAPVQVVGQNGAEFLQCIIDNS